MSAPDPGLSLPPTRAARLRAAVVDRGLHVLRHLFGALAIGTVIAVLLTLLYQQHFGYTLLYSWSIAVACSLFIDGLRHAAAAWVHRRGPPQHGDMPTDWPGWRWMALVLPVGTLLGLVVGAEVVNLLLGQPGWRAFQGRHGTTLAMLMISLVPGVTATFYFRAKADLRAAQTHAEAARRMAAETRLKLLESQLEPHMLFNTLANLRALIGVDAVRAQEMLDRLIAFLRATLQASRRPFHPLAAEFERLADYLALMQVRMGTRLQVQLVLPPDLARAPVPPLLLQPLVENAIQHGLEPQRGGGQLRVEAWQDGDELVVQVSDTGIGPEAAARQAAADRPAGGFGLTQVRERLQVWHGAASRLSLAPGPAGQGGTVVTLRWPARPPADDERSAPASPP
ncbi:sensor histidine kinase [Ideonella sp.]|uniref:sensor histidine kinase n=1 Tax=Ideonella sp. TaxID=1929293 RepID=UPI0035B420EA